MVLAGPLLLLVRGRRRKRAQAVLGFGLHAGPAGPALFLGGILMITYGAVAAGERVISGERG